MDFQFYNLTSNSFAPQSSPTLFWSPSHGEAWQNLVEGIERRQSFIFVLGQAGLGKTALYKTYITQADPQKYTVLYDVDVAVDFQDLLIKLLQLCGGSGATDNLRILTEKLHQTLQQTYQQGRQIVLLIDEAHTLPAHVLHNLSLLSNTMRDETGHLIQIVLFSRPTLAQRRDLPQSELFELGLARASELVPLTREQSLAYINHHLQQVSTEPSSIFSRSALNLIATHARGVPNVINIMCTDVLVTGLLQFEKPISAKTVRGVIGDVTEVGLSPWLRWSLAGAAGLLLAIVTWQVLPTARPKIASETNVYQVARASSPNPETASMTPSAQTPEGGRTRSLTIATPKPKSLEATVAEPMPETSPTPETISQQSAPAQNDPANADLPQATRSPIDKNDLLATLPPASTEVDESTSLSGVKRTRMVCVMPRQGGSRGSDIVLVDEQGNGVNRLISDGGQNMSPALSPDGTLLAYTSYREGTPNIYLRDLKTGTEKQLTFGPWLALPSTWSPNGRYLALSQSLNGNYDIFIYDAQRQRLQRLTKNTAVDVSPSFAPDSNRLVFASDRSGSPQLYLTDVTASPPKRLTQTGSYNTSPAWSPQNNSIAFIGRNTNQSLDLYLIQADGTQMRQLTRGQRFHTPPTWSPDGQVLMGMNLRREKWEPRMIRLTPDGIDAQAQTQNRFQLDRPCLAPQWVAQRMP